MTAARARPQYLPHLTSSRSNQDVGRLFYFAGSRHRNVRALRTQMLIRETPIYLARQPELSPPSPTIGTKLCRNISFPNRPSVHLHGAPAAAAAAAGGKSEGEREPAGGDWPRVHPLPRVLGRGGPHFDAEFLGVMAPKRDPRFGIHICTMPCSKKAQWPLNIAFRSQFAPHRRNGHLSREDSV